MDEVEEEEEVKRNTIVCDAIEKDDLEGVREALALHPELVDDHCFTGWSPIHRAAMRGNAAIVELLIQSGSAKLDSRDYNHLMDLTEHYSGEDEDDVDMTPLLLAAKFGHAGLVELLVRLGSKAIDTPDHHLATPLWFAVQERHADVVELLVRLGSKAIDTPDNFYDCTPMHSAAADGNVSMIELLVRLGSNAIDAPTKRGWTPLHSAASQDEVETIELLVRLGSNAIDTRSKDGRAPLFCAAHGGHVNSVERLVRLGSKAIDTPDQNGFPPVFSPLAQRYAPCAFGSPGHRQIVKTLKALGARLNLTDHWSKVDELDAEFIELWTSPVDEDDAAETRYRVFFSWSLVHRLLLACDHMSKHTTTSPRRGSC